jgi:ATP-dependent DNA helicase PIF1
MTDTLSPEQQYAFEKFKKGENIFITGPGGSGKSKLIQHLVSHSKITNKSIQVCALTGCAAVLLKCGGKTIHSWSGIKVARGDRNLIIDQVLKSSRLKKQWKNIKILIVDEVSMMSEKIFSLLDEIGKRIRYSVLPFGGIQLIFCGDFFQLPPVGTYGEPDTERFCFESPLWLKTFPLNNHIELETIFRQTDPLYIKILSQIRRGYLDEENTEILKKYVKREYDETMYGGITPTKLFPIKIKVDGLNNSMFEKLDEDEYQFECCIKKNCRTNLETGKLLTPEEYIKCEKMTEKDKEMEINYLTSNTPCLQLLTLKKGASVLCTANIDIDNGICNGSQGKIIDIVDKNDKTQIVVRFANGCIRNIEPHFWQSDEYPCIAIGQYPLCLAWALTIHKIQGATLAMAEIDIGNSVFEYGQTYVALSRIQSLDGLYLSAFEPQRIRANPKVVAFYNNIPKVDYSKIVVNPFSDFELKEEDYENDYIDKKDNKDNKDKNIKVVRV